MIDRGKVLMLTLSILLSTGCNRGPATTPTPVVNRPPLQRPLHLTIAASEGNKLVVPTAAITRIGGIPGIFVLRSGIARFQMVKPGATRGRNSQIQSGLRGGESIVVGDLESVLDGSPITTQ